MRSVCGPRVPIILVGCKSDLRPAQNHPDYLNYVTRAQAEHVARDIGAMDYKECSALLIEGVDDVFETATRASMLMRDGDPSSRWKRNWMKGGPGSGGHSSGCFCVVC